MEITAVDVGGENSDVTIHQARLIEGCCRADLPDKPTLTDEGIVRLIDDLVVYHELNSIDQYNEPELFNTRMHLLADDTWAEMEHVALDSPDWNHVQAVNAYMYKSLQLGGVQSDELFGTGALAANLVLGATLADKGHDYGSPASRLSAPVIEESIRLGEALPLPAPPDPHPVYNLLALMAGNQSGPSSEWTTSGVAAGKFRRGVSVTEPLTWDDDKAPWENFSDNYAVEHPEGQLLWGAGLMGTAEDIEVTDPVSGALTTIPKGAISVQAFASIGYRDSLTGQLSYDIHTGVQHRLTDPFIIDSDLRSLWDDMEANGLASGPGSTSVFTSCGARLQCDRSMAIESNINYYLDDKGQSRWTWVTGLSFGLP